MSLVKPYRVFVNDAPADMEEVRVSRYPFNRHWPGYQRSLDQSEVTGLVRFDVTSEMHLQVDCDFDFSEVVIRPLSLGINPTVNGRTITFTITKPCQAVVEFDGTSGALHLFADPAEDYPVPQENVLYFGPGEHNVGHIDLHSGQTVYIDKGAVVYGEIYGCDVENVRIIGKGILDHSKQTVALVSDSDFVDPLRPSPIVLRYSKNVELRGITVRDPFFLAIRPIGCENLHIDNVKVIGCWRYNSDGIDLINTRHAIVENCFVRSFDDSYCLKGFCYPFVDEMIYNGRVYDVMEDVIFRNCVAFNEWGKALEVGVDLCAEEICNCRFENCDVIHASGMAMDISNVDYANIHDITFENIRVEHGATASRPMYQFEEDTVYTGENSDHMPLLMLCNVYYSDEYSSKGERRGKIHNIEFRNIQVHSPRMLPSEFEGYNETYGINGVTITNLSWNGRKLTDLSEANMTVKEHAHNIFLK